MPSGCLSHLTKEQPAHLDALRARLVEAAAAAATTKGRDAVLPERDASKKRQRLHALGKVSSSPAMEQAIVAMAGVRTNLAPITPAAAATEVWRALQEAGVCTQGCRVFCKGFVGSSNDFAYNQPRRSGEPSRAAGIDFKRRGGELMAPEEVVHSRCCAADCTPSLSVEGVQAIRDKWFGLVLAERFHYLVELVWDDVLGQPRPACDARLHQILGVGKLYSGRLLAQARAQAAAHRSAEQVPRKHGMTAHAAAHPPANATRAATVAKVEAHFKSCTYVSPEVINTLTGPPKKYRHCSFSEAGNAQALAKNYIEHAPQEHRVSIGVYERISKAVMEQEGIAVLVGFASDHNVCDECKQRKEATTRARKTLAALVHLSTGDAPPDDPELVTATAEVKRCEAQESEHEAETRTHNAFITGIQIECERQALLALKSGDFSNVPHAAMEDDKSSTPLPSVPLDTSLRASESHNVHGVIDVALQEAALTSTETGAGSKDAHSEIDTEVPLAPTRARAGALTLGSTLAPTLTLTLTLTLTSCCGA
jgi:hypothetical protein